MNNLASDSTIYASLHTVTMPTLYIINVDVTVSRSWVPHSDVAVTNLCSISFSSLQNTALTQKAQP